MRDTITIIDPYIALEMAIPFDDQSAKWHQEYKNRYAHLMAEADILFYSVEKTNLQSLF